MTRAARATVIAVAGISCAQSVGTSTMQDHAREMPALSRREPREGISAEQAVALAEEFFHAKAYGYRFDR